MPTDYSTKDALPMQQAADVVDVSVIRSFRDSLDGRLVLPCTSTTRPTGAARYPGRLIYETDTKMWRTWDGTRWMWAGGAAEIRTVTLPTIAGATAAYVTFPVTSGGTMSTQTNDPDSAFSIVTTAGSEGLQVRDPGIYQVGLRCSATVNAPDAILALFCPGESVRTVPFSKAGSADLSGVPFVTTTAGVITPKVFLYSGAASFSGQLAVQKISGL